MSTYNHPFKNLKECSKGLFPLGLTIAFALTLMILESASFFHEQQFKNEIIVEDSFPLEIDLNKQIIFHENFVEPKHMTPNQIHTTPKIIRSTFNMKPITPLSHSGGKQVKHVRKSGTALDLDTNRKKTFGLGEINLDSYPYFRSCLNLENSIEQFKCTRLKLQDFIIDGIDYPEIDKLTEMGGTVVVAFTVNSKGHVSNIEIVRSVSRSMDLAAINALDGLPEFVPGKQNGRPINVRFQIPITFKIDKNY